MLLRLGFGENWIDGISSMYTSAASEVLLAGRYQQMGFNAFLKVF
jgi:hypothetical protein